jgi:hypothetical protein
MGLDGVGAYSQDNGPGREDLGIVIAKVAGFRGSARRVVPGIEIEHDFPTAIVR